MMNRKACALFVVTSLAGFIFLLTAAAQSPDLKSTASSSQAPGAPARQDHPLLGVFTGWYGVHWPVTLYMDNVEGDTVSGHFIASGERHDFSGSLESKHPHVYETHFRETGENARGGEYFFIYYQGDGFYQGWWTPSGSWKDTQVFATHRFRFSHPEVSNRFLRTADVENLRADELSQMRQEIYAPRGYYYHSLPRRGGVSPQPKIVRLGDNQPVSQVLTLRTGNPVVEVSGTVASSSPGGTLYGWGTGSRKPEPTVAPRSQDATPYKVVADPALQIEQIGLTVIEQRNDALLEKYERYYQFRGGSIPRVYTTPVWQFIPLSAPEPKLTSSNEPLR